jgi:DNA-directed RNA polymerase specialized sigma24 family protein
VTTEVIAIVEAEARIAELKNRHGRPLLNFLLRLTRGERDLAEDLLQETTAGNRSDEAFALVSLGDSSAASGAIADAIRAWLAAWKTLQDLRLPAVTVHERLRAAAFDD